MHYIQNKIKTGLLLLVASATVISSCNKEPQEFPVTAPTPPSGISIGTTLQTTDNLFSKLVAKAGYTALLKDSTKTFTVFVPTDAAMQQFINAISGGAVPIGAPTAVYEGFIAANIPVASAAGIVGYNIVPQKVVMANLATTFPNLQYPSILNPAPTLSALLRLTTFPSKRNGNYVNNIPLTTADIVASNGVIQHTAAVVAPPQQYLYDRINADAQLTYLKAAIARADSGTATPGFLRGALLNIGANLTVLAPSDAAFQATLTGAIYQALVGMGVPAATALAQATALAATPAVFSNPALYSVLTATTVKGMVVYHLFGNRAFTNNFATTATNYPTLLNSAIAAHPGVTAQATFTGPFVSSLTVKGLGNATAANVSINPTPAPNGTSDQHYLNGVLHIINQVLLPQ